MTNDMRVVATGLSKYFPQHQRSKSGGVSKDGWSAVKHMLGQMIQGEKSSPQFLEGTKMLKALDQIYFEVGSGEVLGIIGRNGAGKSTLLKILSRIHHPTAGQVEITGRVISMLELGIGFAPEMTVRENLQIQGRLAGVSAIQILAEESHILEQSGLAEFRDMPLTACPSGSAVKLAFASMINLNADVILADEVLAVGDAVFRHECESRILQVAKAGTAVLFVTHDMKAVQRLCSRVMWIDKGRIVKMGPVQEVVDAYVEDLLSGRGLPDQDRESKSCRILDLRLMDKDRNVIGALQMTESSFIDCVYQVFGNKAVVLPQIEIWQGKHLIYKSTPKQPSMAGVAGTFYVSMHIPAHLLNEGGYRAFCKLYSLIIGDKESEAEITSTMSIDFTVMNPHPEKSVWNDWRWGRVGLICPLLEWNYTA
jgi:lipopolysaccharide transport system ATP-binding protein